MPGAYTSTPTTLTKAREEDTTCSGIHGKADSLGALRSYCVAVMTRRHGKGQSDRKLQGRSEGQTHFTQQSAASPKHLAAERRESQARRGAGAGARPDLQPGWAAAPACCRLHRGSWVIASQNRRRTI